MGSGANKTTPEVPALTGRSRDVQRAVPKAV